jgi:methylmalonyl-CoA mutase cobalamin-binding subunit
MATYSKQALSGGAQGVPIAVVATASTGTTIHATGTSSTTIDEIWLYATNTSSAAVVLTIQYGGTATLNQIQQTIPANSGLTLIVPGLILTGTGAAANTVYAYAGTASVVNISGYVNRVA